MLDKKDITRLLAEFYSRYSTIYEDKMPVISVMLEKLRALMVEKDPYYVWDYFGMQMHQYNNEIYLRILTEVRQIFNELMISRKIERVEEAGKSDSRLGLKLLREIYAEALVHLREEFLFILSRYQFSFLQDRVEWLVNAATLQKYLLQGRWVEAYPFFTDVSNDEELSAEIRSLAQARLGEIVLYYFPYWPVAEKHFLSARAMSENSLAAKRGIGEFYKKAGKINLAREQFLENISAEPHDYMSFNLIGDCFYDEGLQITPDSTKRQENSGTGTDSLKVNALLQVIRQKESAERDKLSNEEFWYNAGWKAQFLQPVSCRRLIRYYSRDALSLRDNEEKIASLIDSIVRLSWFPQKTRQYLTDSQFDDAFNDTSLYYTLVMLGQQYQKAKLYEKADEYYNEAISQKPDFYLAYLGRAYMYLNKNEIELAKADFFKILELDETNYEGYWGLAHIYEVKKDLERAIQMYHKCKVIRPAWSDWVNNFIGNVYFDFAEFDKAIIYYREAASINPAVKIYSDNLWRAMSISADKLFELGKVQEGIESYLALANERNLAADWSRLAEIYADNLEYENAEKYYLKAISIEPGNAQLLEHLAALYEKMHRPVEFENALADAIKANTSDGRSLNKMGKFLQNKGDAIQALIHFCEALQKEPSNHHYLRNIASCYDRNAELLAPLEGFLDKTLQAANIEFESLEYEDLREIIRATWVLYRSNPSLSLAHVASWFAKFLLNEPSAATAMSFAHEIDNILDWLFGRLNRHFLGQSEPSLKEEWYLTSMVVQLTAEYRPTIVNPALVVLFFKHVDWAEDTNSLMSNYKYLPSDRLEDVVLSIRKFTKSPFQIVYLSTLQSIVKLAVGDLQDFDLPTDISPPCYIEFDFEGDMDKITIENFNVEELRSVYPGFKEIDKSREVLVREKKYIREWWSIFEQVLSNQAVK